MSDAKHSQVAAAESRRADLASLRIARVDESSSANRKGASRWGQLFWLISVVLAAAAGYVCAGQSGRSAATVDIVRVRAATAAPVGSLTATGYLQALRRTSIGFKMSGRLSERLVDEGDRVRAGQVLARLECREQKAALARQQAALDQARAALAELEAGFRKEEIEKARWALDEALAAQVRADQDLVRARDLYARKAAAKSALDEGEAASRGAKAAVEGARHQLEMMRSGMRPEQIAAARAQVKQAEAMLEMANTQLDECSLRAPFDATILEKFAEEGSTLLFGGPPGSGSSAAVFAVADLANLEAEVDIAEASLSQVREGQPAEISADAIPDRKYTGVLSKVLPRANRQKAIVPVKVRVTENDPRLRPDLSVKVTFMEQKTEQRDAAQPALRVPLSAVLDRSGAKAVFLVQDGVAKLRVIEAGKAAGDSVEVLGGLSAGDAVVARVPPDLADGAKVKVKGQ
ncbi:MAG: efflux RND transporter periplasmic adaptor subunit [Candidatus Wallbacteria bacterium]|nr:efflux RND transporter periplasmic adaptor subunit [Candidatus Wallbacteria bacterium]